VGQPGADCSARWAALGVEPMRKSPQSSVRICSASRRACPGPRARLV
jgi:hypothetical protein